MSPVLSAVVARTNAEMIEHIAPLWFRPDDVVLDATYGKGNFWKRYRPTKLIEHDLRIDGVDFRALPEADATVDVVVLDPSYVAPGGRETSTLDGQMHDDYDMHGTERTPRAQFDVIAAAFPEAHRVLIPKGLLLLKCMDYVWSGRVQWATRWAVEALECAGFTIEDQHVHVSGLGPQPPGRRQVHARRNYSVLIVARKTRRPSTPADAQGALL